MDVELDAQFPRMTWAEAMRRYGSDKPDLRIALELVDVAELVKDSEFAVFTAAANDADGRVAALRIPGGASLSRKQIDEYAAHAAKYGAKGLAYAKIDEAGAVNSPIAKFFDEAAFAALLQARRRRQRRHRVLRRRRLQQGLRLHGRAAPEGRQGFRPGRRTAGRRCGSPTSRCSNGTRKRSATSPCTIPSPRRRWIRHRRPARECEDRGVARLRHGAQRQRDRRRFDPHPPPEMQSAVFELLGIGAEEAEAKFGFLLDALKYGAPPHGGIAFGIDRIAALMAGTESIRDVIAFPKTTTAQCLMTGAPSPIPDAQLAEVHVQVRAEVSSFPCLQACPGPLESVAAIPT
jgi:aspartyl-tRNA synthetase